MIVEFLKYLSRESYVEINNLNIIIPYSETKGKRWIYFVWGVKEKPTKRINDDGIWKKCYFPIDFDIRKDFYKKNGVVISQEDLNKEAENIVELLSKNWFWDFTAKVYSWNWLHLYYCWTPREFDKLVFADWVSWIYEMVDIILRDTPYKCDPACTNISRIMRLPWTINPRRKEEKDKQTKETKVLWDLWDIECTLEYFEPKESVSFEAIEWSAEVYRQEKEADKKAQVEIKRIVKNEYKHPSDIRKQINDIPANEIAEDIWWVITVDKWLDNVALKEEKKNMWAYWYKPHNVIVNTWSSMIKTNKNYFTPYELVYYEYSNQDKKATLEYFKNKYGIEINEQKPQKIDIPKKKYDIIWYTRWNRCFDGFDCFMSWELVTVVAESNSWKTTFAMDIIKENSDKWRKCLYINLEFPIETVRKQRRLFLNWKKKRNLTDIDPLSDEEQYSMGKYIQDNLSKFDYYNEPKWIELEKLVEKIMEYTEKWYRMFVVDTFSRITGNLDSKIAHTNQNKSMEILQELCQNLWISIVNLHHTNKKKDFEGSQKIHDLSNVFIMITKWEDTDWNRTTIYELSKDKFTTKTEIQTYRVENKPSLTPPPPPF